MKKAVDNEELSIVLDATLAQELERGISEKRKDYMTFSNFTPINVYRGTVFFSIENLSADEIFALCDKEKTAHYAACIAAGNIVLKWCRNKADTPVFVPDEISCDGEIIIYSTYGLVGLCVPAFVP